jgi:hypothetical protein
MHGNDKKLIQSSSLEELAAEGKIILNDKDKDEVVHTHAVKECELY